MAASNVNALGRVKITVAGIGSAGGPVVIPNGNEEAHSRFSLKTTQKRWPSFVLTPLAASLFWQRVFGSGKRQS
jgi:hypothetical protein